MVIQVVDHGKSNPEQTLLQSVPEAEDYSKMAVSDDKIDRTVKKVLVIIFISSLIFTAAVIAGMSVSHKTLLIL